MTRRRRTITIGFIGSVAAIFVDAGCSDPAEEASEVAQECGQQKCPAGTSPVELRSLDASNDISGGFDPVTYKAEGAFKRMGSGKCEYACEVIDACPDGTFPVITEECVRCGTITDGKVESVSCSDEAEVATSCATQECPAGTSVLSKAVLERSEGYNIKDGPSEEYDPENAFMTFDKGECEYACKLLVPCAEGAFPVITKDCFTCTAIIDGKLAEAPMCMFDE